MKYLLMVVPFLASPAYADTVTYYYTGSIFPSTDIVCHAGFDAITRCGPNPNALADAAAFGSVASGTASVTLPFDTTGVTGVFGRDVVPGLRTYDLQLGNLHYVGEAADISLV